jgi:DNA repair exonuclease SbcCD ATPase subunit
METMTNFAHVEQELAELRNQLKQSFRVLDGLAQVQQQFAELAQTHEKFKHYIDKNYAALDNISQSQKTSEKRLQELEARFQTDWKAAQSQLAQIQEELSTIDRTLKGELTEQVETLNNKIEARLAALSQISEHQQTAMKLAVEDIEQRLTTELKASMEQINLATASSTYVEKLDAQLRNTRSSIRAIEKQARTTRAWLAVTTILFALLALGLPASGLFSQSGASPFTDSSSAN